MCLLRKFFYPDAFVTGVDEIPFEALYGEGFQAVLFDIDNTIVMHDAPADAHAVELFERVRAAHLVPVLISNNDEARVAPFAKAVGAAYLYLAKKPSVKSIRRAMEMAGGTTKDTFYVGDQLFTDILGAKAAGIRAVLTKPISPVEKKKIVMKRYLERPILALYRRHMRRRGYVTPGNGFFT